MDPRHRSRIGPDGTDRAPAQGMLRAVGFDDEDFARPEIGVVAAANDLSPCNAALDPLTEPAAHGAKCVGNLAPEAATGAPLALIVDADPITIDIPVRTLELGVAAAELERRHRWEPPPPLPGNGFLAKYSRLVGCASDGVLVGAMPT